MKYLARFSILIIAIFQINFCADHSGYTPKSLGDGYTCKYKETTKAQIEKNKTSKNILDFICPFNK